MSDRPKYDIAIPMEDGSIPEPLQRFLIDNAPHPDPGDLIRLAWECGYKVTILIKPQVAGLGEKVKVPRGN